MMGVRVTIWVRVMVRVWIRAGASVIVSLEVGKLDWGCCVLAELLCNPNHHCGLRLGSEGWGWCCAYP